MNYVFKTMDSPVGTLKLVASDRGLAAVLWENEKASRVPHVSSAVEGSDHLVLMETEKQLGEYFAGARKEFSLPLDFTGTDFHKRVWQALLTIPYGETRTYGQLAEKLGGLSMCRVVGAANGKNPISIVAPCHRVIGANGKLTGFAGGLKTKAFLLNLESGKTFSLKIG